MSRSRHRRRGSPAPVPGRIAIARSRTTITGNGARDRETSLATALAGKLLVTAAVAMTVALVTGAGASASGRLVAWLIAVNVTTGGAYAADQRAARRGERREPELVFHALAALGGSPAALVMARALGHAARQPAFLRVLWVTVAAQGIALAAVAWLRA